MPKIIVIGSSNTDMVIKTAKIPAPGETILGGNFFMNPGGKGANQAVAAARLGGQVHFICKVGQDLFGDMAKKQFQGAGIQTDFVYQDVEYPSGVALINVDAKGENSITVASGANGQLSPSDIEEASSIFQRGDYVLIQLEVPLPTVTFAIEMAHQKGLHVILNPAPAADLPDSIFPRLHAITPNETEASLLTGISLNDPDFARKAADVLLRKGVPHVLITLGAQGVWYATAFESHHMSAPQVEAQDSTAAGDCFNGSLVVGLSQGMTWPESIAFACKAAAISVTRMGAQASMPYLHEL